MVTSAKTNGFKRKDLKIMIKRIFSFIFVFHSTLFFAYSQYDLNKALSEKICEGCDLTKVELANGFLKLDDHNLTFLKSLKVSYGTNLEGANFSNSNLNGSNLNGMNLSESDLRYTNLSGLYLNKTNLENADMRYARSGGSEYLEANLKNAHIEGADLTGSLLIGAKNIETVHCNNATNLPFGYACINGKVSLGNCNKSTNVPIGYYCIAGTEKPQLLPFKSDDLEAISSPTEFYNYFENLKTNTRAN